MNGESGGSLILMENQEGGIKKSNSHCVTGIELGGNMSQSPRKKKEGQSNKMRQTVNSSVGFGLGMDLFASQTQSQFSEFDDNVSAVIINYENLAGFIESSEAQNPNNAGR